MTTTHDSIPPALRPGGLFADVRQPQATLPLRTKSPLQAMSLAPTMPPVVILAAGEGSRLRAGTPAALPKPLTPLLGVPLLERTISTCRAAGVRDVVVVVGHEGDRVGRAARRIGERQGVRVVVVVARDWALGNGASVLAAAPNVDDRFFLVMGDHLFAPDFLRLLTADDDGCPCTLVVDTDTASVHDVDEATKVRREGRRLVAIGKELDRFDGVDTGVFLCRPPLFEALREASAAGRHTLSDAVRLLIARREAGWVSADGLFWQDVDTPSDLRRAESMLTGRRAPVTVGGAAEPATRPLGSRRSLAN